MDYIHDFDEYDINPRPIGAQIKDFKFSELFTEAPKYEPYLDRGMQFGFVAAKQAFEDSNINPINRKKFGIYIGSTTGGIISAYEEGVNYLKKKDNDSKNLIYSFPPASWPAMMGHYFGAEGILRTVGTSCYAGAESVGYCYRDIRDGKTDVALVGGTDAPIVLTNYLSFFNIGAIAKWQGVPSQACRPFSADRLGMVFGEGSAFFVMENLESAKKRNAQIYGEIIGFAATSDGENMVHPSIEGNRWTNAIQDALSQAEISADLIDYVSCHGTGTQLNDKAEVRAIKGALGSNSKVPIGSIKSMVGHSFGGASAIELIQVFKSLESKTLPPTINYSLIDIDCDMDCVPNCKKDIEKCDYILKTATGFGGSNMAMVIKKWTGE